MKNTEIGQRIKQRREELGITAADLADALHFTKATIYRYESGEIKVIKLPVIEAIAEVLKVTPGWLIGKSSVKYPIEEAEAFRYKDVKLELDSVVSQLLSNEAVLYDGETMTPDERMGLIRNLEAIMDITEKKRKR